jgi:hypothetical protein
MGSRVRPTCGARAQAAVHSLDGIIDTVSAKHEISQLLPLLDVDGTLVLLGVPPEPHTFGANSVLFSRCGAGRQRGCLIRGRVTCSVYNVLISSKRNVVNYSWLALFTLKSGMACCLSPWFVNAKAPCTKMVQHSSMGYLMLKRRACGMLQWCKRVPPAACALRRPYSHADIGCSLAHEARDCGPRR